MIQFPRFLAFSPALAGILLQGYTAFILSEEYFDVWLFLYSCLPYAICWAIVARVNSAAGFSGALFAFVADMIAFHAMFIGPPHSTAPIGLFFTPMANLFLFVPAGLVVGWGLGRAVRAYRAHRPS